MAAAEEEPPPGEEDPRREQRYMMIKSLERDKPEFDARNFWPDDLYDFSVWQTDDEVVDFFDSEGRIRPAPAGIDRDGGGDFWDCKVCEDKTNRDPADRQLWVGARVEASGSELSMLLYWLTRGVAWSERALALRKAFARSKRPTFSSPFAAA